MQTLDTTRSYYRRITKLDVIVLLMVIGLLFFYQGIFLSALLIVVYPFSHSKVLVSDIGDKDTKLWVRNMDWNRYRKDHGLNLLSQYKSSGNQVYNQQA